MASMANDNKDAAHSNRVWDSCNNSSMAYKDMADSNTALACNCHNIHSSIPGYSHGYNRNCCPVYVYSKATFHNTGNQSYPHNNSCVHNQPLLAMHLKSDLRLLIPLQIELLRIIFSSQIPPGRRALKTCTERSERIIMLCFSV